MKKFFSLVLALVMALSLTTVAWGVPGTETTPLLASDKASLTTALAEGGYIKVQNDFPIDSEILITNPVTIDLNNKTITGTGARLFRITAGVEVTFKNGTIANTASGGRCIETRTGGVTLNLNSVTLTATSGASQPLTVGGNADVNGNDTFDAAELVTVSITGSTITAGMGYAITTFNPVEMTIANNSTVSGYAALNIKVADGSLGSAGSTFDVVNSDLIGTNSASEHPSNAFSTVMVEDSDVTINIDADSSVTAEETNANSQCIFGFGNEYITDEITGSAVNVADGAELNGTILGINDQQQSIAGKTVTVPAEYADELVAEGYVVTVDSTGAVVPTGVSAAAPDGGAALAQVYDMVTTDASKTKTLSVTVTTYAAKAPYDADDSGLIDAANERGCVKHFVFSNLPGKYFVQVNTVGEADYTVYVTGTKTLLGYFSEVEDPYYYGAAVPFNNFGKNCEQFKYTPVVGTKYYIFQNVVFEAVEAGGEITLMVGNKLTGMDVVSGSFVEHIASYTYNDKFEVTAVKCGVCGKPATIVPNYASLPDDVTSYGPINEKMYYYWPAAAAVVTPDTKVESAETFDAGIAMYVGMSVMAAAGSAVVIGKKKD